jgi:hypothetical protein
MSELLKRQFAGAVEPFNPQIEFVATRLGRRNVAELERLATAIYVTLEENVPHELRATRINELKRHVSLPDAESAVDEADRLIGEAKAAFPTTMTA